MTYRRMIALSAASLAASVAALTGAAPAAAAQTPQTHAMCGAVAIFASMAHKGSGLEGYWEQEAIRVLDATVAAYRASGLKGQKAEDAAFAEVARIRDIMAEDPVPYYTEGLSECMILELIKLK
ncbi:MAG: hypothetical protein RL299_2134 [Pseudomonadota bacterium]|jgi:hypothetical protein